MSKKKTFVDRHKRRKKFNNDPEDVFEEDDDTHDRLTKAYLEYYKLNDKFKKNCSFRTKTKSRKWLREMRRLAKLRMEEIGKEYAIEKQRKGQKF